MPWDVQLPPVYRIEVDGTAVNEDFRRMFQGVTWTQTAGAADRIEFTIQDPDLLITAQRIFAEGNTIDLWIGYGRPTVYVGRGEIWEPPGVRAGRNGVPTIEVVGYGRVRRLVQSKQHLGRRFGGQTDHAIVESLALEYDMVPDIDPVPGDVGKRKGFRRKGMSDWDYLQKLSILRGRRLWIDYDPQVETLLGRTGVSPGERGSWVLHWKAYGKTPTVPEGYGANRYRFNYGQQAIKNGNQILDFSIDFAAAGGTTRVEVLRFDRRTYDYPKYVSELEQADQPWVWYGNEAEELIDVEITQGARVVFTAFGRQFHVFRRQPFKSSKQALEFTEKWLQQQSSAFLLLNATVVGIPDLRMWTQHEFQGLTTRFSGNYELTSVKQVMGAAGYTTAVGARRTPLGNDMDTKRI